MARVRIPRRPSSDEGVESVSSSSNGCLTPGSSSTVSSDNLGPRAIANTVLPSIEDSTEGANDGAYILTNSSTSVRIPSLSLPPSESPSNHVSTPTSDRRSVTRNTDTQNLDAHLRGLRLSASPIDMSGIADALQGVAGGRDSRAGSLLEAVPRDSTSPSPRRSSSHRRRSSSRNIAEKHNVEDEAPPNDRFNDPAFQGVFRDAKRLMRELVDILGSSAVHSQPDSVMQRLHSEAQSLARFQCPPSRIVGLVGASGAGKSSLLNSLLDYRDLTRTSSGGVACTCAVIEYHFHAERLIAVEIEQFSEDEMMVQLESHLKNYRHFHMNRISLNSESSNDSERYKDFEDRAKLAMDTFRAVFGGLRVNNRLLISRSEEDVLKLFGDWVRESGPANVHGKQEGLANDECSALLIRLTSENASASGPATWPWIKKIKVYLNSYILSKGLILVDLPGLEDSNAARRNITERYFMKCDEIFIVCIQDRAVTNEGVRNVVELAKNANISNVSIVCTKSDAYNNPVEAQRDFPGHTASLIKQKVTDKSRLAVDEQELEAQLEEYEQEGYESLTEEENREFNQLNRRLREIRKRLTEHEFDLQKFLMTTCSTSVQGKLIDEYKHQFPNNTLKVFSVSNKIYWDYREAPKDAAMRHLVLSGILALREHGMAMVSQSQFAAAKKYMRSDISLLLREIGLWVQSGQGSLSAEQRHNVRNTLATLERNLQMDLCGRSSELQRIAKAYKEDFRTKIYQPQISNVVSWSEAAQNASYNWNLFHHASYDAFCRKFGVHCVKTEGVRSWNQEIIEEMVKDLSPLWGGLNASITETNDDVLDTIDVLFDSAIEFLDDSLDDSSDTTITLISSLELHKQQLKDHIETILAELQGDLRTLRTDVLSSLRSSYIGKAMEAAYTRAGYESGPGRHARQKSTINAAIQRDDLFTDLLREFRREFRKQADRTQDLIQAVIDSHLDNIRDTFDIVREENAAMECESDLAFKERVENGVKATQDEMEKIYEVLQS